jgi:hypothetical protein
MSKRKEKIPLAIFKWCGWVFSFSAGTSITDFGVQQLLWRARGLEKIDLYNCLSVSEQAFVGVAGLCPALAVLVYNFSHSSKNSVLNFTCVQDLRTTRVGDGIFHHLGEGDLLFSVGVGKATTKKKIAKIDNNILLHVSNAEN